MERRLTGGGDDGRGATSVRGAAQILPEPIEILNAADRALRSEQPEGIVTAFVAILDPITLVLTYARRRVIRRRSCARRRAKSAR